MGQIKVAGRYAKSLLNLANEQGVGDAVKLDVELIRSTLKENHQLEILLKSPVIREDKKNAILKQIFGDKVSTLTFKFIELLTKKGRESAIPEICDAFIGLHRVYNNVQKITIVSAVKLDAATKKELLSKVNTDMELEVVEEINPELIGGFILKIGDKQVDASVLGSFNKLKKEFKNNPFVANF